MDTTNGIVTSVVKGKEATTKSMVKIKYINRRLLCAFEGVLY